MQGVKPPAPANVNRNGKKYHSEVDEFKNSLRQDFQEAYAFYLDPEVKDRLETMGPFKKGVHTIYYILKSLFLKLPQPRQIMLMLAFLMLWFGMNNEILALAAGFFLLLAILILELKDKHLAKDELAEGRAVQMALLPRTTPHLDGWDTWLYTAPANDVGGDLVDHLTLPDHRLRIALGDVAGKGLGAALVMAKLQSSLRALAPHFDNLSEMATETNRIFCRDGLPNRFISLVYLELRPDSGVVRLINAGHYPPIALRHEETEELERGGPSLGLMGSSVFKNQEITLKPGDLLMVYSDGLTEARNEAGDFYGEDRLRALLPKIQNLSARTAGQYILNDLAHFVQHARPSDDLSLVILRRKPDASVSS